MADTNNSCFDNNFTHFFFFKVLLKEKSSITWDLLHAIAGQQQLLID